MKRDKLEELREWRERDDRRPLLVRGARQVGKTWLVREFAKEFEGFAEFNFERNPELSSVFERGLDPIRILQELSAVAGERIEPRRTLVFFDEVQQSPAALRSVRYFREELPELHLVAAGSLLNMVLEKVPTGVGRVAYLNLYPMTFAEFLGASGETLLREMVQDAMVSKPLLDIHHNKLLDYVRVYMLLGGMPAVLDAYLNTGDILRCQQIQSDLLQSFMDDFHKYARKSEVEHLATVFRSVSLQLGGKFKFVRADPSARSRALSRALDLLQMAGLVHKVYHSSADGVPLSARIRSNRFKVIFFDTGLAQRLLGADLKTWMTDVDISSVNRGAVAEQFVGQELAAWLEAGPLNPLTYWHREARGSTAEVDYLLQLGREILPLEVKEGKKGSMKSLHLFFKEKRRKRGIKVSRCGFSDDGSIITVPFYGVERLFSSTLQFLRSEAETVHS
jgi:predicted AAA+ superfamily ATPase